MKKKLVAFTGSGISAESGLKTFRDSDGLWEEYNVYDVATPEAWHRDRKLVLEFYNARRRQVVNAKPNPAHYALAKLQSAFEVTIVTQNIDDLHERAGSENVLHLHGEIMKSQSTLDRNLIYEINGSELSEGDTCERGSQLRPFIVWFGEEVPMMPRAAEMVSQADILLIIGTSLQVYPAAGLIQYALRGARKIYIDPKADENIFAGSIEIIKEKAGTGVPKLAENLLSINAHE
ncbi:MAG TPA: NAD-dependent deacylase [Bacteroidia bacterium]|nr:NAD-dependent deacylase [Bacteroidia bacterium]